MKHIYIKKITILVFVAFAFLFHQSAYVLDVGVENILVKITKAFDPQTDPDTIDVDNNGISDRAHARLLDRALIDEQVPNHETIVAIYYFNWVQIKKDNILGSRCTAIQQLYGITCDEIERFCAGIITLGEPVAIRYFIQGAIEEVGIKIDLKNYNLSGGLYLRATADLDGDKISNRREFQLAEGDFDLFVEKAITLESIPVEGEIEIPPVDKDIPLIITPAVNSNVDFGSVSLKKTVVKEFTAQNIGSEKIPIFWGILGEPEFQIIGESSFAVEPQETVKFQVEFKPKDFMSASGILVIEIYGRRYYIYLGGQGSWIQNVISCGKFPQKMDWDIYKGDIVIFSITLLLLSIFYKKQRSIDT